MRAKAALEGALDMGPAPGELPTEAVEEFISIADGQVVLQQPNSKKDSGSKDGSKVEVGRVKYKVNAKLSLTRIGTRAYSKVMEGLATQVRLDLAQADDARRFAAGGGALTPLQARQEAAAALMEAALEQEPGHPVPLEEQVCACAYALGSA